MSHLLTGIPCIIDCNIDDMLIAGKSQEEHNDTVDQAYVADTLSRAPVMKTYDDELQHRKAFNSYVDAMMKSSPASPNKLEEFKAKQDNDEICKLVKFCCLTQWPVSSKKEHLHQPQA
ncbi:Pol polyprotein [Plakobranchus ocellatus]|uniref:Pol polyprotein n=1 Tax=Plakobranchus ocellatus TaxID=259542 RepID=A0AAV4B9X4_9GAST|nr:Pol polyprotein [Plakobranchus ocellatus]